MILLLVSFFAGILTVLAPCVLPLLPVIVGGSLGGQRSLARAVRVTVSLAVSVILFTLLIKVSTLFIHVPQSFWTWVSGLIIVAFGVISAFPKLWDKVTFLAKANSQSSKLMSSGFMKQNFVGDVIVGASLGPVFSTCSPTYFLVLAAVLPNNFALGFAYLLAYSLGLSLSLLAVSFVGQRILDKAGVAADSHGKFKRFLGAVFIVVGIAILTGADKTLQSKILDDGFFDVTRIEQKLLEKVPVSGNSDSRESVSGQVSANQASGATASTSVQQFAATSTAPSSLTLLKKKALYRVAPEIVSPDGFINTDGKPITLKELRGKVVLLDVWTYSCINCKRTLPYVESWYAKYKDQGFVVVGLHTPEFAFEHLKANVEQATKDLGVKYPVVLDNSYATWNAYGNRYWPRKYLIDVDGYIVYDHAGEGAYDETEKAIVAALKERSERLGQTMKIGDVQGEPKNVINVTPQMVRSLETYFGALRNEYLANGLPAMRGPQSLVLPQEISPNLLYLGGDWDFKDEFAEASNGSEVEFRYSAKNVYFVAGSDAGVDVDVYLDGAFQKTMTLKGETLYSLIQGKEYGEHVLRLKVRGSGLKAFTFTFG